MKDFGYIECASCGARVKKAGPVQKYCKPCSEARDLVRKKMWARGHPLKTTRTPSTTREDCVVAGKMASLDQKASLCTFDDPPDLAWYVRFKVPFTYATSKNHIFAMRRAGHVALRTESRAIRDYIALRARQAVADTQVVEAKVWIDLMVEKPNHRGDAINVIDLVADGLKVGIGVDDRWFCVRRLDWRVQKNDPQIIIGIGQVASENMRICSTCGIAKPYSEFNKNSGARGGIGRICMNCRAAGRAGSRKRREVPPCQK